MLTDLRSVDWQSLTFVGERHEIELRVPQPDARGIADRITGRLADADFRIPGQIVADIGLISEPHIEADGSVVLKIEALTIEE